MINDPADRPTFEEVLAMRDEDIAELAARCNTIAVTELERLTGVIDGLVLPDNYSAESRHMDACCRAGIKGVIRDRIEELQGKASAGPKDAAEQMVATGAAIDRSSFMAMLYADNGVPIKGWQERATMGQPVKVRSIHKVTWLTQDCPCCNADWRGAEIDECERDAWGGLTHYSTVYWRRGEPDTVIIFECPKCAVEFITDEGIRASRDTRPPQNETQAHQAKPQKDVSP